MYSIKFACPQSKVNLQGESKIQLWVNVDGVRCTCNLQMRCSPLRFNKMLCATKSNAVQQFCNNVRDSINGYILHYPNATAKDIVEYVNNGFTIKQHIYSLNDLIKDCWSNVMYSDISDTSKYRYKYTYKLLLEVIDGSVDVNSITNSDIVRFRNYLINTYKYQTETLAGYLKRVKALFEYGVKNGKMQLNPFMDMKIKREIKEVTPLTRRELDIITSKQFVSDRLNNVRDIFLFSCYTGLSFVDLSSLSVDDIIDEKGVKFIRKKRQKTNVQFIIPLSNKAIALLEKYDYQLPCISNQKTNQYLKEIADVCGINQTLHFHLARHTALTMMLEQGVPIEIVAKIAGHKNIRQTQHYSKVNENMVLKYASVI